MRSRLGGDDLVADEVEADQLRRLGLVGKVAPHGVPHHFVQLFNGIGLREDALPDGSGNEAAFRVFFHEEHDLCHALEHKHAAAHCRYSALRSGAE